MPPEHTNNVGRRGEDLAAEHLERLGFRVLERGYRTRHGELDIVAADERTLVFVEVKTRRGGPPWESLHLAKQEKVRRMALSYLRHAVDRPFRQTIRFDAIGVILDRRGELVRLDHLEGAF